MYELRVKTIVNFINLILNNANYLCILHLITVENGLCRLPNETIAGSTLPLLEACKKIANWINDPSAAIWMATLAPRMVLNQNKMTAKSFFIGKNIKSLLRWKINSCNHKLSWQLAA